MALPPHLTVGEDIETSALLISNGQNRGVVLRLLQPFRSNPPQPLSANARGHFLCEFLAIDQPIRLRIGTYESSWEEFRCHHDFFRTARLRSYDLTKTQRGGAGPNNSCRANNLTASNAQSSSLSVSNSEIRDKENTKNPREPQRNRPFSCRLLFLCFSTRPLSTLWLFSVSSVLNPKRATMNACAVHIFRRLVVQNHIASKMMMHSDTLTHGCSYWLLKRASARCTIPEIDLSCPGCGLYLEPP